MGQAKVSIVADATGVRRGVKDAERSLDQLNRSGSKSLKGLGLAGTAAFAGLSIAAAKFGVDSAKAAIDAEQSLAKTRRMVEAAGVSWEKHGKAIDKAANAATRFGFDDEAAAESIANLTRVTRDANKAIDLHGVAMDVARGRGISLEAATALVTKAHNGQIGALTRLGIQIDKNATGQQAVAALQKQFAGQADAYGKTTAGAAERMRVNWENLQEQVGQKLLPILNRLFDLLNRGIGWLQQHSNAIMGVVRSLAPFAAAIGAVVIAVKAWTVAQTLLNAVMNANPALRIVTTIIALGAAIVTAYQNSATFRKVVKGAFDAVAGAAKWAYDKIEPVVGAMKRLWDIARDIKGFVGGAFGAGQGSPDDMRRQWGIGRAMGGYIPGRRSAGDSVPALLTPGEVVLNERQQSLVGPNVIHRVLAMTGGKVGAGRFASGGVASAESFARRQVGEPYVWGGGHSGSGDRYGWDCSGFASNVASRIPGYSGGIGTTMTLFPRSRPARGDEPVVFGFRGMSSNNPRKQHMGIRINGVWYSAGGRFRGVGVGDSRWDHLRVPPGLENLSRRIRSSGPGDGSPGTQSSPKPIRPTRPDGLFTFSQWLAYHQRMGTSLPASKEGQRDRYWRYLAANGAAASAAPGEAAPAVAGDDPDLRAIADQATRNAGIANAGLAATGAFIRTALGPGDIGRGGGSAWQAAGGTVNLNVQTLAPGDPSTLKAIVDAVSRAVGWQGGVLSPQVGSGL